MNQGDKGKELARATAENLAAAETADGVEGLLPCPKCGSVRLLLRDIAGWELDCLGCELSLVLADDPSKDGLVAAWNTRAAEWQPIETAPRDGTEILLGHPDGVIWADEWMARWREGAGCWRQHLTFHDAVTPTHWMPMPPPPSPSPERDAES